MISKKIPPADRTIYNASEACYYIGLSWNTLKSLIADGQIRALRVGRRYLISKQAIDEYMNRDSIVANAILKSIRVK